MPGLYLNINWEDIAIFGTRNSRRARHVIPAQKVEESIKTIRIKYIHCKMYDKMKCVCNMQIVFAPKICSKLKLKFEFYNLIWPRLIRKCSRSNWTFKTLIVISYKAHCHLNFIFKFCNFLFRGNEARFWTFKLGENWFLAAKSERQQTQIFRKHFSIVSLPPPSPFFSVFVLVIRRK